VADANTLLKKRLVTQRRLTFGTTISVLQLETYFLDESLIAGIGMNEIEHCFKSVQDQPETKPRTD
jgi:hypothetical protein